MYWRESVYSAVAAAAIILVSAVKVVSKRAENSAWKFDGALCSRRGCATSAATGLGLRPPSVSSGAGAGA